jgi:methyltransferase (TIGR00027 family)
MRDDSPSATAYLIARSTCFLSSDALLGCFVPQRSAELSKLFVQSRDCFKSGLSSLINPSLFRPFAHALERLTIPGIKLHYALRKRYLEEFTLAALRDGARQVVVIGAGFDTLGLRLHEEFSEIEFFELDHPATQRAKKRAVESHRVLKHNLHFVALDLSHERLEDSLLKHADYFPGQQTLFIAEGLLMYLAAEEVNRIFSFIQTHNGRASKFAFTLMETQSDGRIAFRRSSRLVDAWLRARGESFKWGIKRERINDFLAARGFRALEVATSETLRSRFLTSERLQRVPLAEGECLCLAECD